MRRMTLVVALAPLLALAACGGGSGSTAATKAAAPAASKPGATVNIPLLSFDPVTTTIKAGQTVTWVNGNDINHVLVEGTYKVDSSMLRTDETDDKTFNLVVAKKGDTVGHTYAKAGTFTYYCTIHKGMNATVVVTP